MLYELVSVMHPDWLITSNFRLRRSDNLHNDSHQNSWIYPRVINHPVPLAAMPIDGLKLLFLKAGKQDMIADKTAKIIAQNL